MIYYSIKNVLDSNDEGRGILQGEIINYFMTKNLIFVSSKLGQQEQSIDLNLMIHTDRFSTLALQKFIKKNILNLTFLSKNRSVNPIGEIKLNKAISVLKVYLETKIPPDFIIKEEKGLDAQNKTEDSNQLISVKENKYVNFSNKPEKEKKKAAEKKTLIITGDEILESIKPLRLRGNWLRRDHLLSTILKLSRLSDKEIPSKNSRHTVLNLILLHQYMETMGFSRALVQKSTPEEGFILHPKYN